MKKSVTISFSMEFELPRRRSRYLKVLERLVRLRAELRGVEVVGDQSHINDAIDALESLASVVRRARACNRDRGTR